MEFSIHFFPTVLAPWWEGTGLSCLSQALGRNSFQGCSPGSREQGQHLPTRCNPKSRAWAGEEPKPRWFWESFLGCSAALWWLPATSASSWAQGLSLGRSSCQAVPLCHQLWHLWRWAPSLSKPSFRMSLALLKSLFFPISPWRLKNNYPWFSKFISKLPQDPGLCIIQPCWFVDRL